MIRKSLLFAVAASALTMPALAHNAWFLPSTTVLSDTQQSVTVDAGTSTAPFEANHNAMNIDNVKIWAPDGSMGTPENTARSRYRSTFDVRIDKPGTWRIGMENTGISGSFKVDGEPWTVGRRRGPPPVAATSAQSAPAAAVLASGTPPMGAPGAGGPGARPRIDPSHVVASIDDIPANATEIDLTETLSRNEFFVTAGAPSDALFQPRGKGLEFVPVTLPTDLVSNEAAQFRFLVDGQPAAGLEVEVIPGGRRYRESDGTQKLVTDSDGVLTVNWPMPGMYWLNASITDAKPSNPKASKRRMGYTATLEVLAP